jgi:hypothetical protein
MPRRLETRLNQDARTSQVGNVEMPLGTICNMNIAIRPMGVGDVVDLHAGRKHVDDHSIIERHDASAELFAPDKLGVRRIHGEKITFHPNQIAFVPFYRTDKMTLRVTLEKLPMDDVNVFANVNDHCSVGRALSFPT